LIRAGSCGATLLALLAGTGANNAGSRKVSSVPLIALILSRNAESSSLGPLFISSLKSFREDFSGHQAKRSVSPKVTKGLPPRVKFLSTFGSHLGQAGQAGITGSSQRPEAGPGL